MPGPTEPRVYQQKTVEEWSLQLYNSLDAGKYKEAADAFKTMGDQAVPSLILQLAKQDSFLSRPIWFFAGKLPRPLHRIALAAAKPPEAARFRGAAARALGVIGPTAAPAIPQLSKALGDPAREVLINAAAALAKIGPASVPALSKALTHPNKEVRQFAAIGLREIGEPAVSAIPELLVCLRDDDDSVRSAAIQAMRAIGNTAIPSLVMEARTGPPAGRQSAAKALYVLNVPYQQLQPILLDMIADQHPGCRRQAIETLTEMKVISREAVSQFIQALHDPVAEVRLAAVKGLGCAGRKAEPAVGPLIECLKDPFLQMRLWTVRALGNIGPAAQPAAIELNKFAQDPNPLLQQAVFEALKRIESGKSPAASIPGSSL